VTTGQITPSAAIIFVVLIAVTLYITYWAGKRNTSAASHLVAAGQISGKQNGVAIAGDFISAATFLGITGAISLGGLNGANTGFFLAAYIPIAYLLAMLLVAEPLRNLGHFTLGDVLATRFSSNAVRAAIATSSVLLSLVYIAAQFVAAAGLLKLLFGLPYWGAALLIAVLTTIYTLFGGMLATTYIQIVKTAILLFCGALLLFLILVKFGFNPLTLFQKADEVFKSDGAKNLPTVATKPVHPAAAVAQWDNFSQTLGLTLGVLGLPHVMIRFLTVKNSNSARTSAVTAIWIFACFLITLPILGFGASVLVPRLKIPAGGTIAMPLLSFQLGGDILVAFVSAVTFATILAALSGLVIATSGAVAHDIYGKLLKGGHVTPEKQLQVARIATVGATLVSLVIALALETINIAFFAGLAIAIAASSNLPALLYTMYWKKATAKGLAAGMWSGLTVAVVMILLSKTVPWFAANPASAPVQLSNPSVISIPVGFIVMAIVSLMTQPKGEAAAEHDDRYERVRFQAITGIDPSDPNSVPPHMRAAAH